MQQFNPWPRKEGGEAAKGAGRKEEQGEAGAASLHLSQRGWRRGAAGGFHSLASHQRSCCSPYGIWPFLTNRPPIHSHTHIHEFTE